MNYSELEFIPKISTRPNKIVLYNEVIKRSFQSNGVSIDSKLYKKEIDQDERVSRKGKIARSFHHFIISKPAQQNLRDKISWLFHLSRSRYVKTYSGKEIFNFKINFITLTLPSEQKHATAEITNDCLNQFITELRQRVKMENYVWRLEFQQNRNVHYHIVTDTYIDYFLCQKIWNRIIEKKGYIEAFSKKMNTLTLLDYHRIYGKDKAENWANSCKRFAKGKQNNWQNPPSVDVKNCTSQRSISFYISKYFSKQNEAQFISNSLDNEENSFGIRLWFCSRSLSKLKAITEYVEAIDFNAAILLEDAPGARTVLYDYAKVIYFELQKMSAYIKGLMFPFLRRYADSLQYNSA